MTGSCYAAIDLGAESGRVMTGTFTGERIGLEEAHRFANTPVRTPDGLHWDVLRLYHEITVGLRAAAAKRREPLAGIGVDSWGVDFGLLDAGNRLLGNPYHYRDARTDGMVEAAARLVPAAAQYAITGIAQLPINTLYQLLALRRGRDHGLDLAASLLMIPDLMHFWLTGERAAEYTNATTSGALGVDGAWAAGILAQLDLPAHMLLTPTRPGTVLGPALPRVREACGLGSAPIIVPATHDTAAAVVAVPSGPRGDGRQHAYISSGTWSLVGLEQAQPILSEEARLAGFTNEGGVAGTYRFLTNIMGLWLVQECRRAWARRGEEWSYDDLTARAAGIASPGVVVDVNAPSLLHPDDMPSAITAPLGAEERRRVEDPVALARAILEGLALAYRVALDRAERLAGVQVDRVHIVGGGCRNSLLCQLTADACRRPVLAGPVEATALGNVLIQAMGTGEVRNLAEARAIVRASTQIQLFEPGAGVDWEERQQRLTTRRTSAPRNGNGPP